MRVITHKKITKKSLTQYLKDIGKLKVPEIRKLAREIVKKNKDRDSLLVSHSEIAAIVAPSRV